MLELRINQSDIEKINKKLDKVSPEKKSAILTQAVRRASLTLERDLRANVSGPILKVRSNALRSSIGSRVFIDEKVLSAVIGSGARHGRRIKYANIHEAGGVIRPIRAKFLAIPLAAAKTAGGDVRGTGSPRDFENTFIRGRTIYQKQGKKIVPLFALKKEVRVPARKYMSITLQRAQSRIMSDMLATVEKGLSQ